MKRFLSICAMVSYLVFLPLDTWGGPLLMKEPPLSSHMSWNPTNSGMLFIGYDTDHNGKMDFHTLRVVKISYFSKDSVAVSASNYPENHIFFISYETYHYYYVTVRQPIFYALDIDEDGRWDLMYKDPDEDGVNGNEIFYDSPSGKFVDPGPMAIPGPVALNGTHDR